jgi:multiple sugar transport system ATP-binding protein
MSKILGHLEPQAVFHYFEEIAAIPHGSRNTKKIADYCEQFAKDRGLQHTRDASDNVIIVKPAAKGYETAAPVVLQGHLDMVCEKAPGCTKDMETEGLDLVEENGWVYARGTTLGGDDGIAVAMMLALLDEKDLPAPRLECIITSDEEIGMLGAAVLQPTLVAGRNMINLDSEAEGVFTVSCAGGNRTYCRLPIQRETVTGQTVTLRIAELVGGHSGVEIDKGRANADMLLGRLVMAARRDAPCRLISLTGGSKDNAIPNEATAQLLCEDLPALERLAAAWQSQLRHEYAPAEPDLTITVTPNEKTACAVLTEEGVLAVHDFNLEIKDNEFIVLVGPSGCGKSTTLRMIAGLEEISGGELYIDGKLMNDIPPKDRDIAMVFQNYALYPHMTVYENMAFGLKLRHVDPQEIDRKVKEAAEILDITQYLDRKPKALSGGQRQRVAIGRAIVRSPKVFLMDEPLSNLDAKLRNQMRAEIIKLRQRIDTTFIYVTHDQTEAMTLGDRIVIMRDGEIQQVGTPQEVFDHPANLFVAGFIGMPRMNTFDAQLQRDPDGKFAVQLANAHVVLSDEKQARLAQKNVQPGPIVLGIRPEHIMLAGEGEQMIHGTVDVSEMMGSAVHLHLQACGRDTIIIVQTMSMQGATNSSFGIGQSIAFTFGGNVVHVFDPETGKNLEF